MFFCFIFLYRNPEQPYWPTDMYMIMRRGVSGLIFIIDFFFLEHYKLYTILISTHSIVT